MPEQHPDAYPRNPVGVGWVTNPDPAALEGLALPNFEDPRQRPDSRSLRVMDRRLWSLAPEPQGFGWMPTTWYPRSAYAGLLPLEPALDDAVLMPEVQAGWLPRGFSQGIDGWGSRTGFDVRAANGAASGLRMRVRGGELLGLAGFMPEGEVMLRLPGPPGCVRLLARGRELEVEVALHTLLIEPDDRRLTMLWAARARLGDALPLEAVTARLDGEVVAHPLEVVG